MPTQGVADHQRFTPTDSEAGAGPLSDAEQLDFAELMAKDRRTAEERKRFCEYRFRRIADYRERRGDDDACAAPTADEEPEPSLSFSGQYADELNSTVQDTYTCFTSAPDAFLLEGNPWTGERAAQMHQRLFGRNLPRMRTARQTPTAPRRVGRTSARPRQRRDGSRRHSTRGGTGDDPAPEPDPEDSPPPNDGRRFCAYVECRRDISHMSVRAKYCNASCRQGGHRHPEGEGPFANPYLTLSALDRDVLQARALGGCRCNGSHILDAEFGDCIKCGRPYRDDVPDDYLQLWERRDRMPSYLHAVSWDRGYRVMS